MFLLCKQKTCIEDSLICLLLRQGVEHLAGFLILLLHYIFARQHISGGIFHLFVSAAFGHALVP